RLLTGGLNFSRFSSIHRPRLIGGCTVGVFLLTDDEVAGSVIVAINRAYSSRRQRQTRKNCPPMGQSSRLSGKPGNGTEIAAFTSRRFSIIHNVAAHCTASRYD